MPIARRAFLHVLASSAAAAPLSPLVAASARGGGVTDSTGPEPAHRPGSAPSTYPADGAAGPRSAPRPVGNDPWVEVIPAALASNVDRVSTHVASRPLLAVVKNNAYGLGLELVGPVLDRLPGVWGLAVVKTDEAMRLRDAGVGKPIVHMGLASDGEAEELARRDVRLAPFADADAPRLRALSERLQRKIPVHLYVDTGMGRLGMPSHRAGPWISELAATGAVEIEGTFMTLTETGDFDREQLERFDDLAADARRRGVDPGRLHAASSHGVTFLPEAHLDMVRPGLLVYGAHVSGGGDGGPGPLRPALRLLARVVRVERLRAGDSVSYGRGWVASEPTWTATLPVGHADGYPRQAVEGCEVLIGGRLHPVIGAVSASHAIVQIGPERTVNVGDEAVLVGPDHPAIHPNAVAERTGRSVYDILMHLSEGLPRVLAE